VQVLVEQEASGSFAPHVEWANVKYQLSPDASLRLGRIVLPSFMVSDYRTVGFANTWVRPPVELYGLIPITASDGIDATYQLTWGAVTERFQVSFGGTDVKLPNGGIAKVRSHWGVVATTERGAASFRIAYQQADLTIDTFNSLFDALRQFGPAGEAIAERWDADESLDQFGTLGFLYDPGEWFAVAEWGTTNTHSAVGDRTAWYVSGGYRYREVTPYVLYSTVRADAPIADPGLDATFYPPELATLVAGLNDGLNDILASNPIQSTVSLGMRWDFHENLDFKLQLDHTNLGAGSPGTLGNLQPEFRPGGSYDLISFAIDVLF
jgi:predicted porin